jgi:Raf kinase inhibitor-like YbhB/YbcL family protein
MGAAACRHDGRTLRPARPDQTQSISTTAVSTTLAVIEDGSGDSTADTLLVDDTAQGNDTADTGTLPLGDEGLTVTAPWDDGGTIDPRYTCDGDNIAPAVSWSAAPKGTVEIAITLRDNDLPTYAHWAMAGIAPDQIALAEDTVPIGAYEATNGTGTIGYNGPCPPAGSTHTYALTVHYLGSQTNLTDGVAAGELLDGITAAEIASVEVDGTFSRA